MPTHQLYGSRFPQDALRSVDPRAQRRQSLSGRLQESVGSVITTTAEPGARVLQGDFRGAYSDIMAAELQELLSASDVIGEVPHFVTDATREWAGYYAPREQRQGDRRDPRLANVHTFAGVLTPAGTRRSHVRAVRLSPSSDNAVTNPFGSTTTEHVYLCADASRPRWVDDVDGTVESATVQTTRQGEHRDFDRFDATEPSFATKDAYWLVYDLPYAFEALSDPIVWDTYGRAKEQLGTYVGDATVGSATVGTATVGEQPVVREAWQRVYRSQHEYVGERTIENGRIRLEPRSGVLRAYVWDPAQSVYAIQQLGDSNWRLLEWDITRIGLERVTSLTTWRNTASGATYELVAEVRRGFDTVHFYEPASASSSTPAGLVTRLSPIAHDSDQALGESGGLFLRDDIPDE